MRLFFSKRQPVKPYKILSISESDYLCVSNRRYNTPSLSREEKTLFSYLVECRFKKDGYYTVILSNFDFTKAGECNYFLPMVTNDFIFANATFTPAQIQKLIMKEFDLSKSTYYVKTMSTEVYDTLFSAAYEKKCLPSLHNVCVNFDSKNLALFPSGYVGNCFPVSLKYAKISQEQFDLLLSRFPGNIKKLNFTRLSFEKIDITFLIKKYHPIIYFEQCNNVMESIVVERTSITNAIIDISVLAFFAISSKFYYWFEKKDLRFTLKIPGNFTYSFYEIDVEDLMSKLVFLENTTGLYKHNVFLKKLVAEITRHDPYNANLRFDDIASGLKLLWCAYCVQHFPQADVSKRFLCALESYRTIPQYQSIVLQR